MNIFTKLRMAILGHDIFISYSRKDSLDYAYALARYFMRNGYDCYIDQLSSITPGKDLPANIRQAVKRSTSFILVGSEGALQSEPIENEIDLFLKHNKNKPLIPVDIGKCMGRANWYSKIFGLAIVNETGENLMASTPSPSVLERIENALKFTKKSKRIRNLAISTVLLVLAVIAGASWYVYTMVQSANQKVFIANQAVTAAEFKTQNAEQRERTANDSLKNSRSELALNHDKIQKAEDSLRKAALELKDVKQQKLDMQLLAKRNKAEADKYAKVSFARNLANQATAEMEDDPDGAALKALYALKQFGTDEVDPLVERAFRKIAAVQNGVALQQDIYEITSTSISPNDRWAFLGYEDGAVKIVDLKNRKGDVRMNLDLEEKIYQLGTGLNNDLFYCAYGPKDSGIRKLAVYQIDSSNRSVKLVWKKDCIASIQSPDLKELFLVDSSHNLLGFRLGLDPLPFYKKALLGNKDREVEALSFSDDGTKLGIGYDGSLVEWLSLSAPQQNQLIHLPFLSYGENPIDVTSVRFSSKSEYLLAGSSRYSLHANDTLEIRSLKDSLLPPSRIQVANGIENTYLYDTTAVVLDADGVITTWDSRSGALLRTDTLPKRDQDNYISFSSFLDNGKTLLVGDNAGNLYQLEGENGKFELMNSFSSGGSSISMVNISKDHSAVLASNSKGTTRLFSTRVENSKSVLKGFGSKVSDERFSDDLKRVVVVGDKNACFWDISTADNPRLLFQQGIPQDMHARHDISPDGKWGVIADSLTGFPLLLNLGNITISPIRLDTSYHYINFSPKSKYLYEAMDGTYVLHDLERAKKIVLDNSGNDQIYFNADESWAVTKKDSVLKLWYLPNSSADSLKALRTMDHYYLPTFIRDNVFIAFTDIDLGKFSRLTLAEDGTFEEDSVDVFGPVSKVVSAENKQWMFYYNETKEDNDYFGPVAELHSINDGGSYDKSSFYPGILPVTSAQFNHRGDILVTMGGEKEHVQVWKIVADTLQLISEPVGPFSGFRLNYDFEFSPDDKYLLFHSLDGTPYLLPMEHLAKNAIGIRLKNNGQAVQEVIFSQDGDPVVYLVNHVKQGLMSFVGSQKLSISAFRLDHPEWPPKVLFEYPSSTIYSSFLYPDKKHFYLGTSKSVEIHTIDLDQLKHQVIASVGRNFTWDEWNNMETTRDYSLVIDSLPPDPSIFYLVYTYISSLRDGGQTEGYSEWIDKMQLYLEQSKDPLFYGQAADLYRTIGHYQLSLKVSDEGVKMAPGDGNIRRARGLAYWSLGKFKAAEEDLNFYLNWYLTEYNGNRDEEWIATIKEYLTDIRNKKLP